MVTVMYQYLCNSIVQELIVQYFRWYLIQHTPRDSLYNEELKTGKNSGNKKTNYYSLYTTVNLLRNYVE